MIYLNINDENAPMVKMLLINHFSANNKKLFSQYNMYLVVDTGAINEKKIDEMPFLQNIIRMQGGIYNCHIAGNLSDILTELQYKDMEQLGLDNSSEMMIPEKCTRCSEGKILNQAIKKREETLMSQITNTINSLYERITKKMNQSSSAQLELNTLPTPQKVQEFVNEVVIATTNSNLRLLNLSVRKLLSEDM